MPSKIVFLAPGRLHAIIERETQAGRRAELAEALLKLLHLNSAYTSPSTHEFISTICPCEPRKGESILQEFAWSIQRDPRPNGWGGVEGDHVLNGGLIQHDDLKWGVHT